MPTAVFLVPSQYNDAKDFRGVADHCRRKYWGKKNSVVFEVQFKPHDEPTFAPVSDIPAGFSASFWHSMAEAEQFILLCHCGVRDGPMLGPNGEHPWATVPYPTDSSGDGKELTETAKHFWRRASWAIGSDGKFFLAGCDSGYTYGKLVAKLVSLKVYGFAEHIGTARIDVADLYIGGYFFKNRTGKNVIKC
ncbi:hypothetical protein WDZ92_21450 [Nostoc sp. NIES-2111]